MGRWVQRDAQTWWPIVQRPMESGLSQAAFCAAEGLSVSSLQNWKRKLVREERFSVAPPALAVPWFAELAVPGVEPVSLRDPPGAASLADRTGAGSRCGAADPPREATLTRPSRSWLCTQATDMRRSFDGVSALVGSHLGRDPLDGSRFLFAKCQRTPLKVLYFDGDGGCIWSKRLEHGRFGLQPGLRPGVTALSDTGFQALLEKLHFEVKKHSKRWSRESDSFKRSI